MHSELLYKLGTRETLIKDIKCNVTIVSYFNNTFKPDFSKQNVLLTSIRLWLV